MAGDWIAVDRGLSRKREVIAVAAATGRDRHQVVGLMVDFWSWVEGETVDGRVDGVASTTLAHLVGADVAFWDAVKRVGWLADTEDGCGIVVPNFLRWMGAGTKARMGKTLRQSRWRGKAPAVDGRVDGRVDGAASTKASTREEKRREENKKKELPPIPPSLRTAEFVAAWEEWLRFRAERKPRVTPTAASRAFVSLEAIGPERAVAAIYHSIANSYQGIFEPRAPPPANGRHELPGETIRRLQHQGGKA